MDEYAIILQTIGQNEEFKSDILSLWPLKWHISTGKQNETLNKYTHRWQTQIEAIAELSKLENDQPIEIENKININISCYTKEK